MNHRKQKKHLTRWLEKAKANMEENPLSGSAYREYVVVYYLLKEYLENVKRSKKEAKTA